PGQLDHKRLFELVSKNYETWLQAMSKKLQDEENYLPFPNENDDPEIKDDSAFNFSLLEALEKASNDFSDKINKLDEEKVFNQIQDKMDNVEDEVRESFLKESEMDFLRNKISQMIRSNEFTINREGRPPARSGKREGFSLYDTKDEEGLHEGNTDGYDYDYDDQGDYDIEEINGDEYQYKYSPTHHIEVELNATSECDEHGFDGCDCPSYRTIGADRNAYDEDGPSCEFTFEYDHTGKLVPIYNNVEEKLRMMTLQSRDSQSFIEHGDDNKKKKKKKKKKNKNTQGQQNSQPNQSQPPNQPPHFCLFCEYETIFGTKPRQMIKWYEQQSRKDARYRETIKKKLANAKQRAIRKQKELRQQQLQESGAHPDPQDAEKDIH
ncbi:uncharacterized protein CANTADRAFT_35223, partial [Suhomyces tanzawaensis NRRL Y-17324]